MLKALGSGEDRCPGSRPLQTERLACPGYTRIDIRTLQSPGNSGDWLRLLKLGNCCIPSV